MNSKRELPRGIRIDHSYVQVRLFHRGRTYFKNFGKDCKLARDLAEIHLSEKRKEILMGTFGVKVAGTKRFADVAEIFKKRWSAERKPDGTLAHTLEAIRVMGGIIDNRLVPFFGGLDYHSIKPKDVIAWREDRLLTVIGTTVNREQNVLSSLFGHIERWVKNEQIQGFRLPNGNPCSTVEKASSRKRARVLATGELSKLRTACANRNDEDLWEIIKRALKSLLRTKDLIALEIGKEIDITQFKTGVDLKLPMAVDRVLNFSNFQKRWQAVRKDAGIEDCQFRDLRKSGANLIKSKNYSTKIISEVLGHSSTRTTELYMVPTADHLRQPLADLAKIVDSL